MRPAEIPRRAAWADAGGTGHLCRGGAVHRAENSDTDRAAELAQRHDERRAGAAALILSDYDYLASWATSLTFEVRTAAQVQTVHVHRWVFAVPHVCYHDGDTIQARPLFTAPFQPSETETISWMSYDADVEALTVGEHGDIVPPQRVELGVEVWAVSTEAISRGDFPLRVTAAPRTCTSMAGRFAHLLDQADRDRLAATYSANVATGAPGQPLAAQSGRARRVRPRCPLARSLPGRRPPTRRRRRTDTPRPGGSGRSSHTY